MSRASSPTILALHEYAKLLGIDPLHFASGYSALRPAASCNDIWAQYDWQDNNKVGREQVAEKIAEAERDIAKVCGYWPAPVWISDEYHEYPRPYRREFYGTGTTIRGDAKAITAKRGYVMYGGTRGTEPLGDSGAAVLSDPDGDGYSEWATFTILGMSASLDPCQVKAYFKVHAPLDPTNTRPDPSSTGADPRWEVRPIFAALAGTTLTVRIPRWELFRVDLQERFTFDGIDADVAANYVDSVTLYREYNDPATQISFMWYETDAGVASAVATQTGCLLVQDRQVGTVRLVPGTYDAASDQFLGATWAQCREPNAARLWYRAGYQSQDGLGCAGLDRYYGRLIMILATARLERPLCSCGPAEAAAANWGEDLATSSSSKTHQIGQTVVENPLGTRRGEVYVWNQLARKPGKTL